MVVLNRWLVALACGLGLLPGVLPVVAAAEGPEPVEPEAKGMEPAAESQRGGGSAPPTSQSATGACGDEVGRVCRVAGRGYLRREGERDRLRADQPDPGELACPEVGPSPSEATAELRLLSLEPVRLCDVLDTGGEGSRLEVKIDEDGLLVLGSNTRMTLRPAGTVGGRPCSGSALAQLDLRQGAVLLHHREEDLGARVVAVVTPAALVCLEGTDVLVAHDPGTGTTVVRVENGRARMLRFKDRAVVALGTGAEEKAEVPPDWEPETGAPRLGQLLRDPSELFFDSPLLDPFDLGAVGATP